MTALDSAIGAEGQTAQPEVELEMVRLLLAHHANPNPKVNDPLTPLLRAVLGRKVEILDLLLKAGADPNVRDPSGSTALMLARQRSDPNDQRMVDLLLAYGADKNPIGAAQSSASPTTSISTPTQ